MMKMEMEKNIWTLLALVSLTTAVAAGCGSSSDDATDGGGDAGQLDAPVVDTGSDGPVTFGITNGTYCFAVTPTAAGTVDGCDTGAGTFMDSIPVAYDAATGLLKVGREGSLGQGIINANKGTLLRSNMPVLTGMPLCTWKQTDETMIEVIAENQFTASVIEKQSDFAAACGADVPPGGMCMSTFKWTLKITAKMPSLVTGQCE